MFDQTTTILESPAFQALAQWLWANTPNESVSPEICLARIPRMTSDCWVQVVVKSMGIGMILGACLNKAPTLVNIVKTRSVAGLPKSSIYGETIISVNATLYGYLERYPFTAYGENAAIAIQCAMVVVLMWQYSLSDRTKTPSTSTLNSNTQLVTTQREKMCTISAAIVYISAVTCFLPTPYHHLLMSSVMPIMIYARGSQILEAYNIKHTGAQSIATTSISLAGNLGRILTTIKEVGYDWAALQWYLISALLNFIMFLQYGIYLKNTNHFLDDLRLQRTHVLPKEA